VLWQKGVEDQSPTVDCGSTHISPVIRKPVITESAMRNSAIEDLAGRFRYDSTEPLHKDRTEGPLKKPTFTAPSADTARCYNGHSSNNPPINGYSFNNCFGRPH
jgi:hypothetical protein